MIALISNAFQGAGTKSFKRREQHIDCQVISAKPDICVHILTMTLGMFG